MLRLIFKTLWSRRRRNAWLLAELIVVCIVSWAIFDPVVVVTHDRMIPLGYDADRLCLVSLNMYRPNAPDYDEQATDSASLMQAYDNLVQRVRNYPEVEHATPLLGWLYPNSQGQGAMTRIPVGDSIAYRMRYVEFLPHTQFFETYGFRPAKGLTPAELSDYPYKNGDLILSENTLEAFFHTDNPQGCRFWQLHGQDTLYTDVVGATATFRMYSDWQPIPVAFVPMRTVDLNYFPNDVKILVRLEEGVGMERFLHRFHPWMIRELRAGNLYAQKVEPYRQLIARREYAGTTTLYQRNVAMAVFFLVNLCLGVAGTFWVQTRTRREEVGVMLSYGATPRSIVRFLLGEGVVLTTVSTLVGCILYLQYAISEGLAKGQTGMETTGSYWVQNFGQHFCIVSLIVYLVLLIVVLMGIYIPARRISTISPTEALREE